MLTYEIVNCSKVFLIGFFSMKTRGFMGIIECVKNMKITFFTACLTHEMLTFHGSQSMKLL